VTAWQDTLSTESSRADLEVLVQAVLPSAERKLAQNGDLTPFGAAVSGDGELILFGADPRLGQNPPANDVVRRLYTGARQSAFARRAVAVVRAGRSNGADAMRIDLEHRDGDAVTLVVPYKRGRLTKSFNRGPIASARGVPQVWTNSPSA
jgi:hypothetical protein